MKKYGENEVRIFLQSLDKHLKGKAEIILIGGTAALLAYKVNQVTQDIDTYNDVKGLHDAYSAAKEETGFDIPFSQASVADFPYNFEERLIIYKNEMFKKLIVKLPEIHDFILSKIVRGYEHDLDTISEIVKKNDVDVAILKQRFLKEMDQVVGSKKHIEINFNVMLERCFGL